MRDEDKQQYLDMIPRVFVRALREPVGADVEFSLSEGEATDLLQRRERVCVNALAELHPITKQLREAIENGRVLTLSTVECRQIHAFLSKTDDGGPKPMTDAAFGGELNEPPKAPKEPPKEGEKSKGLISPSDLLDAGYDNGFGVTSLDTLLCEQMSRAERTDFAAFLVEKLPAYRAEMTEAEQLCYDEGWLTPLQAMTVSDALRACLDYLRVVTDPEDPDDLQLLDQVRAAQDVCFPAALRGYEPSGDEQ